MLAAGSTGGPLARVLASLLMVGLARVIYNPRPGERGAAIPDPAHICSIADRAAIERQLFDAFVPAAAATKSARALGAFGHPGKQRNGSSSSPATLNVRSTAATSPGGN